MKKKLIKKIMLIMALTVVGTAMLTGCQGKTDKGDNNQEPEVEVEEGLLVDNAADFLEAIEPGAVITLKKGTYNFTEDIEEMLEDTTISKWNKKHDYVQLNECYDGIEIVIKDVDGLTLSGDKKKKTELQVEPRYADVLRFEGCSNISINDMTIGHTVEQGSCEGDVLEFDESEGIELTNLDLYGCGTYGVTSFDSKDLTIDSTTIHDCSYGAVWFARCEDFLVKDSTINNNEGYYLLDINNSDVEFRKCDFYGNVFEWGVTAASNGNDLTFKGCSFGEDESSSLYYGSFDGCTFDSKCEFMEVLDGPGSYMEIENTTVYSVRELIEAIASDAYITVAPGYYNISDFLLEELELYSVNDWNQRHTNVSIEMEYDGPQLNINNVNNLTIIGGGETATDVEIFIDPRYSDVLHFNNCSNVYLGYMNMGHTSNGQCIGNVIGAVDSTDISLYQMDLYGCGVYGISTDFCDGIIVDETYIHDCEYGFAQFYESTRISFDNCVLMNSGGGVHGYEYETVKFSDCYFGTIEGDEIREFADAECVGCSFESDGVPQPDRGQYDNQYGDAQAGQLTSIDMSDLSCNYFVAYKIVYADGTEQEIPYDTDEGNTVYMELTVSQDGKGSIYGYEDFDTTSNFTWTENNGWGEIAAKKNSTLNGGMLFAYVDGAEEVVEMDIAGYQIYFK